MFNNIFGFIILSISMSLTFAGNRIFSNSFESNASTTIGQPKIAVFIPGGGWLAHNSESFGEFRAQFESAGYRTYLIEYPYWPYDDVQGMELFVGSRMIDIRRQHPDAEIIAIGGSAGGHLALRAAFTADRIVAFNPVIDTTIAEDPSLAQFQPPLAGRYQQHVVGTPKLILHGTEDALVPITQVRNYVSLDGFSELIEIEGVGHGWFNAEPVLYSQIVLDWVEAN